MNQIQLFRAGRLKRQWAFRFVATNGKVVAQSETYRHRIDAARSAGLVAHDFTNALVSIDGDAVSEQEFEAISQAFNGA